jgi:hypothetical protein
VGLESTCGDRVGEQVKHGFVVLLHAAQVAAEEPPTDIQPARFVRHHLAEGAGEDIVPAAVGQNDQQVTFQHAAE